MLVTARKRVLRTGRGKIGLRTETVGVITPTSWGKQILGALSLSRHLDHPGQEIYLGCQKVTLRPSFSLWLTYTLARNIASVDFKFSKLIPTLYSCCMILPKSKDGSIHGRHK